MMATIMAVLTTVAILTLAIRYIIKQKQKGIRCIGCPAAGSCNGHCSCSITEDEIEAIVKRI